MMKGSKEFYRARRETPVQAMRRWIKPYIPPRQASSLFDFKYMREMRGKSTAKSRRAAVALTRAFGRPFYFNGAYVGAEND